MLCDYKDIFGAPNTGLHSYRIFNIALVDVLATFVLAYILSIFLKKYKLSTITILLFISSIIIHKFFCVETTLTKLFKYTMI